MASPPDNGAVLPSRRGQLWLLVALLVIVSTAVAVVAHRSSEPAIHDARHGPLTAGGGRTMTSIKAEVGQDVTFGGIVLYNSGNHPVVLERVTVDPPPPAGLAVVDIKAAGKDRKVGYVGADVGFPPRLVAPDSLRPLEGSVVPGRADDPQDWGVEVVFGFKVTRPGKFGFRHVVVDYRVGGRRHRVRLDDGFAACAPIRDFPSDCSLDQPA